MKSLFVEKQSHVKSGLTVRLEEISIKASQQWLLRHTAERRGI